jgi:hypothetical protein
MLIMRKELMEAEDGWMKNLEGRHSSLAEIVQVAATAIRCIQRYGATGNTVPQNDLAPDRRKPAS